MRGLFSEDCSSQSSSSSWQGCAWTVGVRLLGRMAPRKGRLQCSWILFGVIAALALLLRWHITLPYANYEQQRFESHTKSRQTSGTTGLLFSGAKQRAHVGPVLFSRPADKQRPSNQLRRFDHIDNVFTGPLHPKWAVVTTIFQPSEAVRKVAALQGWFVVVVGDVNSAAFNMTAPNVVLLDAATQQQLGAPFNHVAALLPWRHFGRKNIGFLYAIQHGAQVIWDFDDDNILKPGVVPQRPDQVLKVQATDDACRGSFNPYPHMGGPIDRAAQLPPAWPRGYPLDLITVSCTHSLRPGNASEVAVVQSLADKDPDVDAVYRLTRPLPFSFTKDSQDVLMLSKGVLAPWNAQATLLLQPSLWLSLLPITVHGRVSDIWRSYISQRLLWDAGYHVAFVPPMVDQLRSPHTYLADFQAEQDLYLKSGQLVELLRHWQGSASTMEGRFEELMIELYERGYVELQDVALAQHWLQALVAVGYQFPTVINVNPASASVDEAAVQNVAPARPQPMQRPQHGQQHWAVFLSSAVEPTPAMKTIAGLDGWHVLVVAGNGSDYSNQHWQSMSNLTYLSTGQQNELDFNICKHLSRDSVSLKNIGYLYAIKHGAQVVYDVGDTVELMQNFIPMLSCWHPQSELAQRPQGQPCRGEYTMLRSSSLAELVINPYPLFGQPHIHPRGMLNHIFQEQVPDACFKRSKARPLVHQAMINGRPDVDCTYHGQQPLDVTFDQSAFAVVLPHQKATYLNSYNTVFLQDALWALLLPKSTATGMEDVLRGFWTQRLLWDLGSHVALLPATVTDRSIHCKPPVCIMENAKKFSAQALMKDLLQVQLTSSDLPGRMLEITSHMFKIGYLQEADVRLMEAWITDLHAVGYQFPEIAVNVGPTPRSVLSSNHAVHVERSYMDEMNSTNLALSPSMWLNKTGGRLEHSFGFPRRWCTRLDTQLVLNMNNMEPLIMPQIPLLHALYRPWFRRVFFASTARALDPMSSKADTGASQAWLQQLLHEGYFIDCSNHTLNSMVPGGHQYACAAASVLNSQQGIWRPDNHPQTFNVLHSNDDVAFSPCMMEAYSRDKFWAANNSTRVVDLRSDKWHWWDWDLAGKGNLRNATQAALSNAWGLLAARIKHHGLQPDTIFAEYEADLFYVPARHQADFVHLTEHFQSFYTFSEVAVPAAIGLLKDTPGDVEFISLIRAFDQVGMGRQCVYNNITKLLPMAQNASMAVARACVTFPPWQHMNTTHAASKDIFGVHPIKLSIPDVVQHWVSWWLSQRCG